jgi:hypothetical protein
LNENIDAIAAWDAPLFTQASPCNPPSNFTILGNTTNISLSFTAQQAGNYNVYLSIVQGNIAPPPNPNWSLVATINALSAGPQNLTISTPISPFGRFVVTRVCP